MADTKITALTAISTVDPAVDVFPIVDVSDTTMAASGTTKKITSNQLLGAGGTATLASATITGDLTVDTNTLKVDSANNRVGIGTASPSNSIHLNGASGDTLFRISDSTNGVLGFIGSASGVMTGAPANSLAIRAENGLRFSCQGNAIDMTLSGGNLGLGVTPSAWVSTVKALDISSGGAVYAGSLNCGLAANYYLNSSGNYIYKTTAFAAGYIPNYANNGSHVWFNAPSGTAGNAVTFTQAMTLDASGNLCVGTATAVRKLTVYDTTATPAQFESSTTDCQLTLVTSSGSGGKCFIQASAGALLLGSSASERARIDANGNFMVGVSAAGTTAAKTIQIANGTAPTANITGGQLYVEAGALKYRGSSGTVTTIANA